MVLVHMTTAPLMIDRLTAAWEAPNCMPTTHGRPACMSSYKTASIRQAEFINVGIELFSGVKLIDLDCTDAIVLLFVEMDIAQALLD